MANPFEEVELSETEEKKDGDASQLPEVLPRSSVWRRDSAVVLIGTTNRGKTTTMNIFTGNTAEARGGAGATTANNKLYRDVLKSHGMEEDSEGKASTSCAASCTRSKKDDNFGYPLWLDTIGLHEAKKVKLKGREVLSTQMLVQDYLKVLYDNNINYVHAVVWCMTPEEAHTQPLEDEAEAIQFLLQNCDDQLRLGANILILVKEPRDLPLDHTSRDVQGALECLPQSWRRDVLFEGYELKMEEEEKDGNVRKRSRMEFGITREEARERLEAKLGAIEHSLHLQWKYSYCLDCGQIGDERLFHNSCHLEAKTVDRFSPEKFFNRFLNAILCGCNQRTVCKQCDRPWPRERRDGSVVERSQRCVQISDFDNLDSSLERCPMDKGHNSRPLNEEQKLQFERIRLKKLRNEEEIRQKQSALK